MIVVFEQALVKLHLQLQVVWETVIDMCSNRAHLVHIPQKPRNVQCPPPTRKQFNVSNKHPILTDSSFKFLAPSSLYLLS